MPDFTLDPDVLRTIYGEAANQGDLGMQAVASVIANRARQAGQSLGDVGRAPGQFEGLKAAAGLDPGSPALQRVAQAVGPILTGAAAPITDADSFYSPGGQAAKGRSAPSWDDGSGVALGGHVFLKTGYGGRGAAAAAATAPAPAGDLDDILGGPAPSAGAAPTPQTGGAPAAPNPDLDDIVGGPAPAPAAAPTPGAPGYVPGADKGVTNADTGVAANNAQAHTLRALQAAGRLNIDPKNPGSGADNPMLVTGDGALPGVGKYYVGLDGEIQQVPDAGLGIARADEAAKQAVVAKTRLPVAGDVANAALSPIADEMNGLIGAGSQGLYNLGARAVGAPVNVSMGDRYTAAVEAERAAQDKRDAADPIGSGLGRVAGGFALGPEAGAGGGALKTAAQVLGTGAAYGAADTRGGIAQRALGAGTGAATAAATAVGLAGVGGLLRAAPRVVSAIPGGGSVVEAASKLAGSANDMVGGIFGRAPVPSGVVPAGVAPADAATAARYVQGLQAAAGKSDAAIAASDQPTMAEALGKTGINHAAMLARRSGTSADLADQVFLSRRDARSGRILQTLSDVSGVDPTFVAGDFKAQMAGLRQAAAPLYDAAYDVDPPTSSVLDDLMNRPSVKAAMPRAISTAREEGRDPEALGLRDVEAPAAPSTPLDDDGPSFSDVLAGVRRGDDPKFNRGPSVLQYISRNGGIADKGGDIADMDAAKWHLNKPFWNKLINPAGDSADGWGVRLQENGYFPDMAPDQRPSIGDVHDLISDELAGAPTYSRAADPAAVELQGRVDSLRDHLRHLDIGPDDLAKMSDDDVSERVNPVEGGAHPYAPPQTEPAMSVEPSMQSYDYLKRALNDGIESYRDGTTGKLNLDDKGRAMVGTAQALRDELVNLNPRYGAALKQGGEPLRQEQAWRSAPQLMSDATPEAEFFRQYGGFTPAQQKAFQGGAINNLYVQARQGRLTLNTLKSSAMASKLQTMFGAEGSGRIGQMLAREKAMVGAERSVPPGAGSPTMGLQQAAREADGGDGGLVSGLAADALATVVGHGGNVATAAPHFLARNLARVPRALMKPTMAQPVRDEAGRMLMAMSPQEFQAYVAKLLPSAEPQPGLFGGAAPVGAGWLGGVAPTAPVRGLPVGLFGAAGDEEKRRLGW